MEKPNGVGFIFFFDSKYLISHHDYKYTNRFNDEVSDAFCKSGEQIDDIEILKGALVLEGLCKQVAHVEGDRTGFTYSHSFDKKLYYTLLLNLTDSLSVNWHTFSRKKFLNLCSDVPYIECVVFNNLSVKEAITIDNTFQDLEYYIGASTMDYNNPLHIILFNEYLIKSVRIANKEILYVDVADINNWDVYYPGYKLQYVENLKVDRNIRYRWEDSPSPSGLEAVKILLNKGRDYHHNKLGIALIRSILESKIDCEYELHIDFPNAERAIVIPREKLEKYALNIDHPAGGPKAKYFKDVLSIEQSDWRYMEEQIRLGIHEGEVCNIKINEHGIKYYVDIGIEGLNGSKKAIRTTWIIRQNEPIQLTSLYPLDMKEQFEVNYDSRPMLAVPNANDIGDDEKWGELYLLAKKLGEEYSFNCIPTPIFIEGVTEPLREGLYGWAYIVIYDKRHDFVEWLRNNEIGFSHEDHYIIKIDIRGRYEKSLAFAEGFYKVMRSNQIDCEIQPYLD